MKPLLVYLQQFLSQGHVHVESACAILIHSHGFAGDCEDSDHCEHPAGKKRYSIASGRDEKAERGIVGRSDNSGGRYAYTSVTYLIRKLQIFQ